jgi:hypothetical protein
VPERCTCGALLPPEARFCHKCGKPQYDEPLLGDDAESEPEPAIPVVPAPAAQRTEQIPQEISFHNRLAVRTAFSVAALSFLFSSLLAFAGVLAIQLVATLMVTVAGGFLAAYLYSRRSHRPISVAAGARMGWLTGIFSFLINMVVITMSMIAVASQGGFASFYQKQSSALGLPEEAMNQVIEITKSPALLILVIGFALLVQFLTYVILTSLGGALGAKVMEKE